MSDKVKSKNADSAEAAQMTEVAADVDMRLEEAADTAAESSAVTATAEPDTKAEAIPVAPPVVSPVVEEAPPAFATPPQKPTRRLLWRLGRVGVWLLLLFSLVTGGLLLALDRRFDMPEWVRSDVEARLERNLGGMGIEFGAIQLVLNRGWRPRVSLRDVALSYPDGTPALAVADAQATLAMRPLLRGQFRPKSIYLSGLFAILERGVDGTVSLRFGDGQATFRQAESFALLMEQWDQQLTLPILSALTTVQTDAVTLRLEDQRLGRGWTLDGGVVELLRAGDAVDFDASFSILSGRGYASAVEASYQSAIGDVAAEFALVITEVPAEDVAVQSAALGWLGVLRAPISGALRGAVGPDGVLLPLSAGLQVGAGVIQPEDGVKPVPIQGAESYFTFDPAKQDLVFESFQIDSGWVSGNMQGRAELQGVENGQLRELVGQLAFTDLNLNPARVYETPLALAGVTADFLLELDPFRLRLGQVLVERDGFHILAQGEVWAGKDGWDYDLTASSDRLTPDLVKTLWPTTTPPKPRSWFKENVLSGELFDAEVGLRGRAGSKPKLSVDLSFRDSEVKYHKVLPNVVQAAGQFSLHDSRLVVTATEGLLLPPQGGPVDVAGTSFIIPDTSLKEGEGFAILRAEAQSEVTAALSLLNLPTVEVMDRAGLPVELGTGQVTANGTMTFPLKDQVRIEEIEYHYAGRLRDVRSDQLVPGHVLEAADLAISGDQSFVEISGPGTLSGIPIEATWRQAINQPEPVPGRVAGIIEVSPQTIETLDLGLPKGSVTGKGSGQFAVTLPPGGTPELRFSSDLVGVGLRLPDLAWSKAAGSKGELGLTARLQDAPVVEQLRLVAPGLSARGRVTTRAGGGLARATFSDVSLGGWLNGAVTLEGRGNATPSVVMSSGNIDLRRIPFDSGSSAGSGGAGGGNTPITLQLERLQVTDSIVLNAFSGRFSTRGGFNGEFSGRLNNQAPVTGVVVPQQAGLAMRVNAKDAGQVLRAAKIIENGHGGDFEMTLVPTATTGEYSGQIKVGRFRIKGGPAITALVNSISLVGLVNELAGQGIQFNSAEAKFRLAPDYLTLSEFNAVGASIGVSLDGLYNLNTDALDMRGVLTPVYLLNSVGSVLTRRGEGLFAFAFRLRGTGADPKVSVNPLSALAPGFLREAFRGRQPLKAGEERKKKTAEEWRAEREQRREDR